ncbi:hypothetical protein E1212_26040 [Jiangella ureilytica]|uniref:Uncharacterized protein n=1 Tax=Jiangella ureilytica TaxID=2530374 RepID=A0A4R4RC38_9ACTN|nr:Rv3235 family protein [Jiangella ureilytica]TDC46778.1 hypothetical protein E1212_26040 [Jiangella ureilytica]
MTTTQAPPEPTVSRARRLPLPVTEPPFDDELGIAPGTRRERERPGQGLLPLGLGPEAGFGRAPVPVVLGDQVVADSLWLRHAGPEPPSTGPDVAAASAAVAKVRVRRRTPAPPPGPGHAEATGPAVPPHSGDGLPEPRRWIARLAQSALECLHGRRSLQQLTRWTDEPVYRALARRAAEQEGTPGERPRIRALRVCRVTATVAEASVVVQLGRATRAVAVRLQADDGRWLCTAFDIVDPGPPPRGGRRQRAAHASSNATA